MPGNPNLRIKRLIAVVSAAQGQSLLVGKGGEVVRMHALHHETNQRSAFALRPEHPHPGQFSEPSIRGIGGQLRIVLEDPRASDVLEVIDRRGEADRAGDVRRASFKAVRRLS